MQISLHLVSVRHRRALTTKYVHVPTINSHEYQFWVWCYFFKVGIFGYASLQTMSADKWATSKSTQLSTKVWVKLLLLLENALKLNY